MDKARTRPSAKQASQDGERGADKKKDTDIMRTAAWTKARQGNVQNTGNPHLLSLWAGVNQGPG